MTYLRSLAADTGLVVAVAGMVMVVLAALGIPFGGLDHSIVALSGSILVGFGVLTSAIEGRTQ